MAINSKKKSTIGGDGGLTDSRWQSDRQGLAQPLEKLSSTKVFSREFNDSNLYGPRRRTMVLTQNSHKYKEHEKSGNYRVIK
jgi:hypothetical protein